MNYSQALVPKIINTKDNSLLTNTVWVLSGTALLALLAQVALPLPWTPVPITGQTFGIAIVSLLWGRSRGLAAVACYLLLGFIGLPIFALGRSGLLLGPTSGYLLGMLVASFVMGHLSDKGWCQKFWLTYLVTFIGSSITFVFGLIILSNYIPSEQLAMAGLIPFLPGDFIKSLIASAIVYKSNKVYNNKNLF